MGRLSAAFISDKAFWSGTYKITPTNQKTYKQCRKIDEMWIDTSLKGKNKHMDICSMNIRKYTQPC